MSNTFPRDLTCLLRRDWSPGSQEVEQAELALQLLAEVLPEAAELAAWPQLHEAFSRLAARWGAGMVSRVTQGSASTRCVPWPCGTENTCRPWERNMRQ